jgi:hypothetical protein
MPLHEIGGIFAAGPAILPFCCPALLAAYVPESAFLPKIAFHESSGKSAGNVISRLVWIHQLADFQ